MNAFPVGIPTLRPDVLQDWKWASKFEERTVAMAITKVFMKCSTLEEDYSGTDWSFDVGDRNLTIACRMRRLRSAGGYRDFTVRSRRASGAKTELEKIRDGSFTAKFYVYAWIDTENQVNEYVAISMDAFRKSGLVDTPSMETANRDGSTWFVAWSLEDLWRCGCIVAGEKYPGAAVSFIHTKNPCPIKLP